MGLVVVRLWKVIGDVIVEAEKMMIVGASGVNTCAILYISLEDYFIYRGCLVITGPLLIGVKQVKQVKKSFTK